MKRKWKVFLILFLVLLVTGGILASIKMNQRGIVTVQTGRVVRQDLTAIVTASGEIKPKNYINLGANAMGPLTDIRVKEGDHVRKGQVVAQIENTQPGADVAAQQAAIRSAEADSAASEAGAKAAEDAIATANAGLDKAKAELQRTKLNIDRAEELYKGKLLAKQDYDQKKAEYDSALAMVKDAETRVQQSKSMKAQSLAQELSAQRRVAQAKETVVPGIQSSVASTIMTVADMSLITAEVKVDETDIVNVKLDQQADITIDAIPNKTFKGHVTEIGNTAILRSTGLAASQSAVSSQEAKDFKVVIALDNPPSDIRPGLSCTAKVVTATRKGAVSIPIQALTVRQKGELAPPPKNGVQAAAKVDPAVEKANKEEIQGVFVIANGKAEFRQVDTGITGATDIEVVKGLNEGDEIVTGSYKVIRTLRNEATVKIDNKAPVKTETS